MSDLYAVLGWPVAHSRSPAMHNAALRALGMPGLYVPLAVPPERLPQMIESIRALHVRGVNVTLPHKSAVMPLLDELTPAARAVCAVNTLVWRDDKLHGDNTDAEGLARSLIAAEVELRDADVVLLGAGGAARAAAYGLARMGAARITFAARRTSEAEKLARELAAACGKTELRTVSWDSELSAAFERCSLLVQSTSATLVSAQNSADDARAFAEALPIDALPKGAAVVDLVYKPLETAVLARARARGLQSVDGLGMLLHQGALAFERWTGRHAPTEVMRRALLAP